MIAKLVSEYAESDILSKATENCMLQIDKYEQGKNLFNELVKDKPYIIRNIALNFLLNLKHHFLILIDQLWKITVTSLQPLHR